jgi:hypothetical protein
MIYCDYKDSQITYISANLLMFRKSKITVGLYNNLPISECKPENVILCDIHTTFSTFVAVLHGTENDHFTFHV